MDSDNSGYQTNVLLKFVVMSCLGNCKNNFEIEKEATANMENIHLNNAEAYRFLDFSEENQEDFRQILNSYLSENLKCYIESTS